MQYVCYAGGAYTMKMTFLALMIAVFVLSGLAANAVVDPNTFTYSFSPAVGDLNDLPHEYYYTWGIKWNVPTGQTITGATLIYHRIYDWTAEPNDHLYTHLLNTVLDPNNGASPNYVQPPGKTYQTITIQGTDNEGGGDKFAGQGVLIGNWNDPYGNSQHAYDQPFSIPSANFAWLSDGNFGFGIDPDCHYYNCGIELKITTQKCTIPEPMSIMLGVLGLGSVAGFRRLRAK
jgi:hypothetical protein